MTVPEAPSTHRLAVLPLRNISPDPADAYFADGLTEELISILSRLRDLRVIARSTAMRYRESSLGARAIARELDVGFLLEGSVRKAADRLRVSVQLVDGASEEPRWSETYDRDLRDVFALQNEIARRVARALQVHLRRADRTRLDRRPTETVDAYTLYLQGRQRWNQRTADGLDEAVRLFESARAADPHFALASAGLSDALAAQALLEFRPPSEAFPAARLAAERAVELDHDLAEAHAAIGLVRFQYDRDWAGAEESLRRAIALNPNYPTGHQFYADFLKAMGRFDEAIVEMERARELDPLSLAIGTGLGHVLYLSRQYDRAIEQYRRALALDPSFAPAHLWFGRPFLQTGRFDEAIAEIRTAVELSHGSTISLAVLGHALASAGRTSEAREVLGQLAERATREYLPSYWIALVHVGLGERSEALRWLERAEQERSSWLAWLKVEPRFDTLREEPRFVALLRRMHLDEGSLRRAAPDPAERQLGAFLAATDVLRLDRYRVTPEFLRFDEASRHALKDLRVRLAASLAERPARTHRYLLWAPPGSGKTFFVREVARELGCRYVELNLAEADESAYRAQLRELAAAQEAFVCLLDEIDSQPEATWPFEALLPVLEGAGSTPAPRLFLLAGSSGPSLAEFVRELERRPKGPDLVSRLPHTDRTELPPLTPEDRIVLSLGLLARARTPPQIPIREVEKVALEYLATEPALASARQHRDFLLRSVRRVPAAEDRLRFDHLFEAGDARNKEYWFDARARSSVLLNHFLRFEA